MFLSKLLWKPKIIHQLRFITFLSFLKNSVIILEVIGIWLVDVKLFLHANLWRLFRFICNLRSPLRGRHSFIRTEKCWHIISFDLRAPMWWLVEFVFIVIINIILYFWFSTYNWKHFAYSTSFFHSIRDSWTYFISTRWKEQATSSC